MALIKEIELENGVTVNYHRVLSVRNITNHGSIIEVASYTSKSKREEEKQATNGETINVFIYAKPISIPYDKDLNVDTAYEYLKTTEEYKDSEND